MPSRQFRRDPDTPQRQAIEAARARVRWPALALFVVTGFWGSGLLAWTIFSVVMAPTIVESEIDPPPLSRDSVMLIRTTWSAMMILVSIAIALGALQMYQLRSRQWAYCAAILAMVPCLAPCYIGALPLGVWTFAVLRRQDVELAFDENARLRIKDKERVEG